MIPKHLASLREAMVQDALTIVEAYLPQYPNSRFLHRADGLLAEIQEPLHFDEARGAEVFDMEAVQKWITHLERASFYTDVAVEMCGTDGPSVWFRFPVTERVFNHLEGRSPPKAQTQRVQFSLVLFNTEEDRHPPMTPAVEERVFEMFRAAGAIAVYGVGAELYEMELPVRTDAEAFLDKAWPTLDVEGAVCEILVCFLG